MDRETKKFYVSFNTRLSGVKIASDFDESFSMNYYTHSLGKTREQRPLHYHAKFEMFFVADEPITIQTETETREFKNAIVLVPPTLLHATTRSTDYRFLFSFEVLDDTLFSSFMSSLLKLDGIMTSVINTEEIKVYLEEMRHILTTNNEMHNEMAHSVIKLLFYHYFEYNNRVRGNTTRRESYLITIENMLAECVFKKTELSLERAAKELSLSKKHTARIIKGFFGKSLSALVLEKRLIYARELLEDGTLSVLGIAKEVGFQSENYFFTKFKEKFGLSPLKYRKKFQALTESRK